MSDDLGFESPKQRMEFLESAGPVVSIHHAWFLLNLWATSPDEEQRKRAKAIMSAWWRQP